MTGPVTTQRAADGEVFRVTGDPGSVARCIDRLQTQGWRFVSSPVERSRGSWEMRVVKPAR